MADDLVLDQAIRSALRTAARPGDPTGVAEAIRARLDGGPEGGPGGSGGPAGGSGPTGPPRAPLGWLVGAAVLSVAAGAALGWSGALSPSTEPAAAAEATISSPARTVSTYDCPGAAVVGSLMAGDRVLALGTHEGWAAVRDPRVTGQVVWVDADVLTVDPGQVPLESLALSGCPELVALAQQPAPPEEPAPEPEPDPGPTTRPTTGPAPDPAPAPAPPVDNPPTVGQAVASPSTIVAQGCAPDTASVSVVASDDNGIASVTMSWSGGSAGMSPSGSTWSGTFGPIAGVPESGQDFLVTVVATDTAGQTASTGVTVQVTYCLI